MLAKPIYKSFIKIIRVLLTKIKFKLVSLSEYTASIFTGLKYSRCKVFKILLLLFRFRVFFLCNQLLHRVFGHLLSFHDFLDCLFDGKCQFFDSLVRKGIIVFQFFNGFSSHLPYSFFSFFDDICILNSKTKQGFSSNGKLLRQ